jgi:hypothetical protein
MWKLTSGYKEKVMALTIIGVMIEKGITTKLL